jgi:hypothetical protein
MHKLKIQSGKHQTVDQVLACNGSIAQRAEYFLQLMHNFARPDKQQ